MKRNSQYAGHAGSGGLPTRWLWLLLCAAMLAAPAAFAQKVYVYRNAQGQLWFTGHPAAPSNYTLETVKNYGQPPAWRSCIGLSNADLTRRAVSYTPLIERIAAQHQVPWELVRSIISVESCFDPKAESTVGARGLMQLMPDTAKLFGITDLFNPEANLQAGVRYLARLIKRYNGNLHLALAAYNAGPGAVKKYGGIPPYPETQRFVRRVMAGYDS